MSELFFVYSKMHEVDMLCVLAVFPGIKVDTIFFPSYHVSELQINFLKKLASCL